MPFGNAHGSHRMDAQKKNVVVLAGCQAITQVKMSMLIAIAGLSGYALAADKAWATLPVTIYVIGSALATLPSGTFMKRYGRRGGFALGATFGIAGGVVCAAALWLESFLVLCVGTAVLGVFVAFGRAYRFAAADSAPQAFKARQSRWCLPAGSWAASSAPIWRTGQRT